MKGSLVAAFAWLCISTSFSHADWCGKTDEENWDEFSSLFWAETQPPSDRPVIYVASAPWCPYCAEYFKATQGKRYSFDVRFIPLYGASTRDDKNIADLVTDGTAQALARTYILKTTKEDIPTPIVELIKGIQYATSTALIVRFGKGKTDLSVPTSYLLVDGNIITVPGAPNLNAMDKILSNSSNRLSKANTYRFLETGIPVPRAIYGTPVAKFRNTRIRVMPDRSSFSILCLTSGFTLQSMYASGVISIDGEDWIEFSVPAKMGAQGKFYGLGADFDGWDG